MDADFYPFVSFVYGYKIDFLTERICLTLTEI